VNRRNYWTRSKEYSREGSVGSVVMLGGGRPNWIADCYSSGYRVLLLRRQHARGVNPITHLELVPRLEMPGDTPPLPHTPHGELLKQGDNFIFVVCFLLGNSPASEFYVPTFRNTVPWLDSVPKRRHIKFRPLEIIQKKAYYTQNTAKVWNQGNFIFTPQLHLHTTT
jgi:hypothetical protein